MSRLKQWPATVRKCQIMSEFKWINKKITRYDDISRKTGDPEIQRYYEGLADGLNLVLERLKERM